MNYHVKENPFNSGLSPAGFLCMLGFIGILLAGAYIYMNYIDAQCMKEIAVVKLKQQNAKLEKILNTDADYAAELEKNQELVAKLRTRNGDK